MRFPSTGRLGALRSRLRKRVVAGGRIGAVLVHALASAATLSLGIAQEKAVDPFSPDHRQIWVPRDQLDAVLAKFPRAILLNRAEYEALVRDAGKVAAEQDEAPPAAAVIEKASFVGVALEDIVRIRATFEVDCLTDKWAEVPLSFGQAQLASATVDETTALRSLPSGKGVAPPALLIHGKGRHTVEAEFHIPIERGPAGQKVTIANPRLPAAKLSLTFPQKVEIRTAGGFLANPDGASGEFEFPKSADPLVIEWTSRDIDSLAGTAIQQTCRFIYHLDSTVIHSDFGLRLTSALAELPKEVRFPLPADGQVLDVEGRGVESWTVEGQQLLVRRFDHQRHQLDVRILVDTPSLADEQAELTAPLPMLQAEGVFRAEGSFAILGGESIRVQEIAAGPLLTASLSLVDPAIAARPDFVTGFEFPVIGDAPRVTLRRAESLIHGSLDTHVSIQRDGIRLRREFTVQPREGSVFESRVTLPEGESIVDVTWENDALASWSQSGGEVVLKWKSGLVPGSTGSATILSRIDPEGWHELGTDEAEALQFVDAETDLDVLSGYLAIDAEAAYQIETVAVEGLEDRDGRTTPVTGKLAWFRSSDYALEVNVSRRASEVFGQMTAYALPLTNTLEIEGQLLLTVNFAPIRALEIALPVEVAQLFKIDSPLVSEQRLDEATGVWTLRFHQEIEGQQLLRWRMSLPFEATDADGEKRFEIGVPAIALPGAGRLTGHWMLEANTDTELSFEAEGLDPVDSLRIPSISGYSPRHRVIAAYGYRGSDYSLTIDGVRHSSEDLVTTIIDDLAIDSVVSTDGVDRHQVQIVVRTAGDQFLEVGLPEGARLWSLLVDHEPVKPVRNLTDPGSLRIHLPAHVDAKKPAHIRLIFESDAADWGSSGRRGLATVRIAETIPILRSNWRLHLPEGYSYRDFESNLTASFEEQPKVLLGHVFEHWFGPKPASAALRYTTELARLKYKVEDDGNIVIVPLSELSEDLYALTIRIPPTFLAPGETPRVAMENVGIAFPAGSSASYDLATNQLTVRNTQRNLDLVEAYTDSILQDLGLPTSAETAAIAQFEDEAGMLLDSDAEGLSYLGEKLKLIVIPEVEFDDTPLSQAIEFLRQKSIELDDLEPDPAKKGVNLIVRSGRGNGGADLGFGDPANADDPDDPKITLKLRNVPLVEALRYTTELARLKYKVEPHAVVVVPIYEVSDDLVTQVFRVPPGFLSSGGDGGGGGGGGDPFADTDGGNGGLMRRKTAKDVLEETGIVFPPGASAIYNPATSELIVRNNSSNVDMVEAYTEALTADVPSIEDQMAEVEQKIAAIDDQISRARAGEPGLAQMEPTLVASREELRSRLRSLRGLPDAGGVRVTRDEGAGVSGLMPLEFELPDSGQTLAFAGLYAPEPIQFRYTTWDSEIWWAWVWISLGGVLFWLVGRGRPVFMGLFGILVLTFLPVSGIGGFIEAVEPNSVANGILLGWIVAFALRLVWGISNAAASVRKKGGATA